MCLSPQAMMGGGNMPSYELTCIFHPSLSSDEASALVDRIEGEVASHGTVSSTDVWGRMRLAYPIQKVMEGTYVHYTIDIPGQTVALIERWLHLQEPIIRHLIVKGIVAYEKAPQSIAQGMRERVAYSPRTEEAVSEETVSEEVVSEETVSEEAVSEEVVSEEAVSEEAVSE
ncbi:MAG: 30S ribosomal protein S6, partial [Dehalococcoidia bacterium]|nr:30S ribosomal protein S6 [Dehalococcoidia bacterium]